MRMLHLVIALTLSTLALPALANDFYVDGAAGDDANPGTTEQPFETIQKGIDAVANPFSTVHVNGGTYTEAVTLGKNNVRVLGVGRVFVESTGTGMSNTGNGNTIENIIFRRCQYGIAIFGTGTTLLRCTTTECSIGVTFNGSGQNTLFRQCTICCNNSTGVYLWTNRAAFEQCSIVNNALGIDNWNSEYVTITNCIFAFNSGIGIQDHVGYVTPVFSYNDFFANGQDYVGSGLRPTDLSVDPEFTDLDAEMLTLRSTSPLINTGRDSEGIPVSIGRHGIGTLASDSPGADVQFSQWTDSNGTLVTQAGAEVILDQDGLLRLNGVESGAARSPVIDLGPAATVTAASYRAQVSASAPTGSRRVVDADDSTFARETRIRASDTLFGAQDALPNWVLVTSDQALDLIGRYVQFEARLTTRGK